jgi:hypothetical protein
MTSHPNWYVWPPFTARTVVAMHVEHAEPLAGAGKKQAPPGWSTFPVLVPSLSATPTPEFAVGFGTAVSLAEQYAPNAATMQWVADAGTVTVSGSMYVR